MGSGDGLNNYYWDITQGQLDSNVMTGQGAKRKTRGDFRDVVFITSGESKARESIKYKAELAAQE